MKSVIAAGKVLAKKVIFREGQIHRVMFGPLRGTRIPVSVDMGWEVLAGRWEPYLQAVYTRIIRPGNVCYDLGANTGIHTALFSRIVGETGRVIAFEPHPRNVAILSRVLELNAIANATIVEAAVADRNGTTEFLEGEHQKQGSIVGVGRETGSTITVATRTIDSLVEEGLPPPDFLKFDIEGAESRALTGAMTTLSRHRPTMVIELHTPEEDLKVGKILQDLGYGAFRVFRGEADREHHPGPSPLVQRLDQGWPTPEGLWGVVVAAPVDRLPALMA